ncbi:MAG: ankyrin repeat domain-containing protein [Planctomycetota bacterium]
MAVPPTPPPAGKLRNLPEKPDLDQLKTQAKQLHRAAESGDAEALRTVARHFPRREGVPLTLSQAQLVLARSYGFDRWPKLKAHVDGITREALVDALQRGDAAGVAAMLRRRPEMADATTGQGELRLLHLAVMRNDAAMLRLLMDHGADARQGVWPHRESTTPLTMATERGLGHLVAVIEDVETERQQALSCPNVTVSAEQEQLAALIRAQQNEEALAMLEADPTLIKQCDRDGATPLHVAAAAGNETMVEALCDRRADARKRDGDGWTPIDRAVFSVHMWRLRDTDVATRIARRLLRRGCEMTSWAAAALGDCDRLRDIHRQTPERLAGNGNLPGTRGAVLTRAVIFDQKEAVACLLDLGLDPNEPIPLGQASDDPEAVSWGGPLWNAAAFGRHEIAELLLDRGADPNGNVYASGWPLDRAYERGDRAMVELLYARGAKPTPWTVCAAYDQPAVERLFQDIRNDADAVRSLVWSAACCCNLPALDLGLPRLMELRDQLSDREGNLESWHDLLCQPMRMMGTEPNAAVRPAGWRYEDRFTILQRLLDAEIDPNARGRFGLTVLHFVAARGDGERFAMPEVDRLRFAGQLLDAGADPSLRDELLCSSALGWACRYGRLELVEALLSRGVPVEEHDAPEWAQPRAWAAQMGHDAIAERLGNPSG